MFILKKAGILFVLFSCLGAGFGAGQAVKEFQAERQTRVLAINNNCGAYNAKTGMFEWVKAETAESIIVDEPALARAADPLPKRKPRVPK